MGIRDKVIHNGAIYCSCPSVNGAIGYFEDLTLPAYFSVVFQRGRRLLWSTSIKDFYIQEVLASIQGHGCYLLILEIRDHGKNRTRDQILIQLKISTGPWMILCQVDTGSYTFSGVKINGATVNFPVPLSHKYWPVPKFWPQFILMTFLTIE